MIDPTDQDIAEALRLAGYSDRPDRVAQVLEDPKSWRETLAHARTIAKLRILAAAAETSLPHAPGLDDEDQHVLRQVLAQIKEAGNG